MKYSYFFISLHGLNAADEMQLQSESFSLGPSISAATTASSRSEEEKDDYFSEDILFQEPSLMKKLKTNNNSSSSRKNSFLSNCSDTMSCCSRSNKGAEPFSPNALTPNFSPIVAAQQQHIH